MFAKGARPTAADIGRALDDIHSGTAARISHRPDPAEGWLELLVSGLTFDLGGLAPAPPVPEPGALYRYGFERDPDLSDCEAVELVPSGHIAAGAGLQPVVRAMAGLAAGLVLHLPVAAVAWHPARTLMEPRYFSRMVLGWLGGGAFPALGLTALSFAEDGSISSDGLAEFIGQEMRLEGREAEQHAETMKLAIRAVDFLVRNGPLTGPRGLHAEGGDLVAEPSQVGRMVWIWRDRAAA